MYQKIKMPKERIPISTRGIQIHKHIQDYDRNSNRIEIHNSLNEMSECVSENNSNHSDSDSYTI